MDTTALWYCPRLVLLALLTGCFGGDLEINCGDGDWVKGHRGCYYMEMELKTWEAAKQDCQDRGGLLLSIGSVLELKYINEKLKPLMTTMDRIKWWVGLEADQSQPGRWRWADGGEFNPGVSKWAAGEPNNADDKEKCVELNFRMKLNDAACDQKHPFVCENMGLTTTTEMTTSLSTTQPPASPETRLSTVPENTAAGTAIRRRDTKGPAIRVTGLPTAPSPDITPPSTTGTDADTKTRTPDIMAANSTLASASGTSAEPNSGTGNEESVRNSDVEQDYITHATSNSAPRGKSLESEFCEQSDADGLKWPRTKTGSTAEVQCANGVARWRCEGDPARWIGRPVISDCVSRDLKTVFSEVLQKQEGPVKQVSAKKVAKAASSLATITQQKTLTAQEVVMTTRALSQLTEKVDFTNSSVEEIKDVASSVIKTTSSLLSKNKTGTWSELPKKDQRESAASMLEGVEKSALAIAQVIERPQTIKKKEENIELQLVVLGPEELNSQPKVVYESDDSADEFVLPSEMLKDNDDKGLTKIVFVTYHKIADLLQPEATENRMDDIEDYSQSAADKAVVSNVISVSVHGKKFENLKTPITFTMKHTRWYPANSIPSCVFWKFARSGIPGDWSVEGCGVVKTNSSHTVCQCNHLTNFAVLMDVQRVQISDAHAVSLELITYAGCIVSAVCLVVSWITFQLLKCLQGERNSIHKNLVFCLFVAEILFLFGIDKTYNKILCATLAGLMHYFFLASFTWMFLEGVHIVIMIVQVFDAAKSRLKWYYFAGYGIPLTIVSVSAAVNYQGYGTSHYCWLTTENLFIWSFAGPIALILLVNATILTYAMSTVCKHSEYVIKEKNRSDSTRAWIQGALALEVLLGLTWVFGYFYINEETIVMAYIFTVLNSLQGLFIFCFHCLLNKKVRKEYKRVLDISRVTTSTNTRSATRSSLHRKQDPSYEMYVGNH